MAERCGYSLRTFHQDVQECEFRGRRGLIRSYEGWEHDRSGAGAQIVDVQTGEELAYTEWYDSREKAIRCIKVALGLAILATALYLGLA